MRPQRTTLICPVCSTEFRVRPSRIKTQSTPIHCSTKCWHSVRPRRSLRDRLEEKYIPEPNSGCWLWLASLDDHGYGQINAGGNSGMVKAYAAAYRLYVGDVPDGLELDHLCRNRACVNPDHLEPVTRYVNLHRGANRNAAARRNGTCINGHPREYFPGGSGKKCWCHAQQAPVAPAQVSDATAGSVDAVRRPSEMAGIPRGW